MPTAIRPTNTNDTLVGQLLDLEDQAEAIAEQIEKVKTILLDRIAIGTAIETPRARVAATQGSQRVVDIETLEAVASRHWFIKLTKRVLNTPALNAAAESGALPADIAEIVQTKTTKPSLRITRR